MKEHKLHLLALQEVEVAPGDRGGLRSYMRSHGLDIFFGKACRGTIHLAWVCSVAARPFSFKEQRISAPSRVLALSVARAGARNLLVVNIYGHASHGGAQGSS